MAKKKVTKEERETIVNFNEGEYTAVIYTFNNDLKKRLAAFAEKYPDLVLAFGLPFSVTRWFYSDLFYSDTNILY